MLFHTPSELDWIYDASTQRLVSLSLRTSIYRECRHRWLLSSPWWWSVRLASTQAQRLNVTFATVVTRAQILLLRHQVQKGNAPIAAPYVTRELAHIKVRKLRDICKQQVRISSMLCAAWKLWMDVAWCALQFKMVLIRGVYHNHCGLRRR